jgi:hypothetical protein
MVADVHLRFGAMAALAPLTLPSLAPLTLPSQAGAQIGNSQKSATELLINVTAAGYTAVMADAGRPVLSISSEPQSFARGMMEQHENCPLLDVLLLTIIRPFL